MRILIYGINFHPELTGIGKYTGELATYLTGRGDTIRVVTAPPYYPQWEISTGYSGWKYHRQMWNSIEVYRCPLWVPKKQTGFRRILHLISFALSSAPIMLAQIAWNPDVVFSIAPTLIGAPVALITSKVAKSKSWLHIQDFEVDAAFNLGMLSGGRYFQKWAQKIESSLYRRFDIVSTISNRMLERLSRKDIPKSDTLLFPNWVDSETIFPMSKPSPYREELGISDDKIVALYSGNMGAKQGLEALIEAARLLQEESDITFILCGEGAARKGLVARADGLPNLRFMPLQPSKRLNELLNLADIHLLPQRVDAADLVMPSKLMGMLASGKPVIATTNEDTQVAQIVDNVGLIVSPENPNALADELMLLAKNRPLRKNFGELGRSYAAKNWGKEEILNAFHSHLEHLAGR